jgi:hypothetical protein
VKDERRCSSTSKAHKRKKMLISGPSGYCPCSTPQRSPSSPCSPQRSPVPVDPLMPIPLFSSHGTVKNAIWLWLWLWTHAKPSDGAWEPVSDGMPISDAQIAVSLDVGVETVRRWRQRLEGLGFIRSKIVRPRHRRFWIAGERPIGPARSLAVNSTVN